MELIDKPLAERMRPNKIDDIIGQDHLIGNGKPLSVIVEGKFIPSFILWGPPGCGKTTIARIISNNFDADFYQINAVSSGVKEIRDIIEKAKQNSLFQKKTILFIDEIHRFNKSQQDALLDSVEKGLITLIGATTENPSFEVISPLLSRCQIYKLNPLSFDDLVKIIDKALASDELLKNKNIKFIDKEYLAYISGGDARSLLNTLEMVINYNNEDEIVVDKEKIDLIIQNKKLYYDKDGEEYYNLISAFIKSLRGSDPDAALYYMARMLEAGEDPLFIARRMIILASEDVGNASPNALLLANATFDAVSKIGMPEARIILSQCATYLASAPKSNAAYLAIDKALEDVRNGKIYPVPTYLRNPVTKLMADFGYGKGYHYAHDYENHFYEMNFFPKEMENTQYYYPTELGQEKNLKDRLKALWKKFKKY
ncbi:MAG TPA: replication-associated recombination protein A [Ignavibacteriales bacterium]|nr:replication-associated recombination protein A [Ignavibacteriales bacterium]HOL81923.1 replication-associated recombination protein A [Ignavibacteriales bacterium]HPP34060.1 replication-associated recombination protein A [Ignavibacteriales bacterium]